jgi:hypothetical protein
MTEYGRQLETERNAPELRARTIDKFDLSPGQEYTRLVDLKRLYEFRPGETYSFRLTWWGGSLALPDESGKPGEPYRLGRELTIKSAIP